MYRLFSRYWPKPAAVCFVAEVALVGASLWGAHQLLRGEGFADTSADSAALQPGSFLFVLVVVLSLYLSGLYDFQERRSARSVTLRIVRALACAGLALIAINHWTPWLLGASDVTLSLGILLSGPLLALERLVLAWVVRRRAFNERILIVGADASAVELAREILKREHLGFHVVGFLDDDPSLQGLSLLNPCVIGTTSQASSLALAHGATQLVVSRGDYRGMLDMDDLLACKTAGVRVSTGLEFYERLTGKVPIDGLRKSSLVFSDGFVISRRVVLTKRVFDTLVAALALALAAPLIALMALVIPLESRGPAFFSQERVGRRGKQFRLWKLRSMREDAESAGLAKWAAEDDPRVTRLGKFIRRARIDELPQLWNVLIGQMSLVGPRPEREQFVEQLEKLSPYYAHRLSVRPGLTGWAQIKAPYAASLEESMEKLQYDLYYIKHLSLSLDVSIVASTLRIVLMGRGGR